MWNGKNSIQFPKQLKTGKEMKFDWNTKSGVIVDDVLALLWVDNSIVTMLTTIHRFDGVESKSSVANVARGSITSMRLEFQRPGETVLEKMSQSQRSLTTIIIIWEELTSPINDADIIYTTQISTSRNWMPLFFWLLDTSIVNSYLV